MEKVQITINLPKELLEQLRGEAKDRGYTIKDLIMSILKSYFENIRQE